MILPRKRNTMNSLRVLLLQLFLLVEVVAGFVRTIPHSGRRRPVDIHAVDSSFDVGTTTIDIDPDTPRDMETFQNWATACGVTQVDGFQLTITDTATVVYGDANKKVDISAMTTEDLPQGTTVLYVPRDVILSSRSAVQEIGRLSDVEGTLASAGVAEEHIQWFYLFLKILREYQAGEESPWYLWLNSLPRYHANGASMTANCFECLPPLVGSLAKAEAILAYLFFISLGQIDFLRDEIKTDKEVVKWAFSIAYTRGFPTPDGGDIRIVPMGDMLNHATFPQVEMLYDEQGNAYAMTTADVPQGSPLCTQYGDPTNPSHLLARYGFLDESSPATFCKIMIDSPSEELINMGYDHSKMLFFKDTGDVSEEVWDVLLYQNLVSSDPDTAQTLYQAHMTGDAETKQAIHQYYFAETLATLQDHVQTFLQELEKLQRKAASLNPNEHPRAPIIMAHNAFVRETFLTVQSKLYEFAQ
eukprot:scaffold8427_cov162-Amphora_coffeaeformis.AAC.3